ncbi:MAG: hypothetical protein KGI52_14080 [Burkholderiales bacterium]|nr:hypothetical protein [Burkholderiales bacterium]
MITSLKQLADASEQDVFDTVATHLLTQRRRSMLPGGEVCAYRSPNGDRCAAGCLIGPDEYSHDFEEELWRTLIDMERVPRAHGALIARLQSLHDDCEPEKWRKRLRSVARMYALNPSVLDTFAKDAP